ncbi:slit homolog 2 protein-like [Mytilus californianus]|uniref:slit homolog 2 protein-like n=1 Tax=Mytilus californianus TaxID=6549 RepID=UPI0022463894|nr:slit homolog 2 protein-like [Mytilus californianus]
MEYLSSCNISTIETGVFSDLPRVRTIYLSNNDIFTLHKGTFRSLQSVYTIKLDNNKITSIHPEAFRDLPSLQYLYVRNCQITTIQQGTFQDLRSIYVLLLHDNKITTIQEGSFLNLTRIHTINLTNNNISVIEENAFINLGIQAIFLGGSHLKFVNVDTFKHLNTLWHLDVELVCDCKNFPFWSWIRSKSFSGSQTCLDRYNIPMSSLQSSDFDKCTIPCSAVRIDNYEESVFISYGKLAFKKADDTTFIIKKDFPMMTVKNNYEITIPKIGMKKGHLVVLYSQNADKTIIPAVKFLFTDENYFNIIKRTMMQSTR